MSKLPSNIFQTGVANYSAAYWGSGDTRFAACAMSWFLVWAKGNALTGTCNYQGRVTRKLLFAGMAHSYLRIKTEQSLVAADRSVVEAWISRVGSLIYEEYTTGAAASGVVLGKLSMRMVRSRISPLSSTSLAGASA